MAEPVSGDEAAVRECGRTPRLDRIAGRPGPGMENCGVTASVCSVPDCPRFTPCPIHRTWNATNGWRWSRLRAQVLERDRDRCVCSARATIVHHLIPLAAGGDDTLANLRSLCDACDGKAHGWANHHRR